MTSRQKALSHGHIRKTIQNLDPSDQQIPTTATDDHPSHLSTRSSNRFSLNAPRPQATHSTPSGPSSTGVSPRSSQPSLSSHPTPSSSTHSLPTTITSSADSDHASATIAGKRPAQRPSGPGSPPHSHRLSNANQRKLALPSLNEVANGVGGSGRKRVEERGGTNSRKTSVENVRRAAASNNNSSTDLGTGGASGSMPTGPSQQSQERIRAFDREKIGLAGKGYGSLLEEDNGEEISKLLDKVTDDDILKLTQLTKSHPKPKSIGASTSTSLHKEASARRSSVALAATDEEISSPAPHNPDFHPSANTLALSRRFKDSVSQKYTYIYATINRGESYNPLQAIRDRPIRASDPDAPTATTTHDEPRVASQRQTQHTVRHVSSGPLGRRKKPSEWLVSADEMEEEDAWRRANPHKILLPGRMPPRINPTVSTSTSSHGTGKAIRQSLSDDGRWSGRSSFEDLPRIHIESLGGPHQESGLRPTNSSSPPQPSVSPFQSDSDGVGGGMSSGFDSPPRSPRPPNLENPRPIRPDQLRFQLSQSEGASPASSPSASPPGSPRRIGSPLSRVLASERENHSSPDVSTRDRYDDEEDEQAAAGSVLAAHRDKRKTWHIPPLFKKDKTFLLKKHHRNASLPHASVPDDDDPTLSAFVPHDDPPPRARPPIDGGERMARTGSAPTSHGPLPSDRLPATLPDMSHPAQDSSSQSLPPYVHSETTTANLAVVDTRGHYRKRSSSTSIAMRSKGEAAPMSPTPSTADDSASIMGLPPTRRHSFDYTTMQRGGEMVRSGSAPIEEGKGGKKVAKKITHFLKVPGVDGTSASEVESGGEEGGKSEWEEREGVEGGRKDRWRFFRSGRSDAESDNSSSNRTGISAQPPSLEKHSPVDFTRTGTGRPIPLSTRSSFEDDTRPPLSDIWNTVVPEEDSDARLQVHRNRSHEPVPADGIESMGEEVGSRSPSPDPPEALAPVSRIVTVDLKALPAELADIVERYREMGKVVPIGKKKGKERESEEKEDDRVERTDDEASTEEEDEGEEGESPGMEEGAEGDKNGKGNLVEIEVSESDDIDFVKQINHDDDSIIELHVSILGDPKKDYKSKQTEMKGILDKYAEQIERLERSLAESGQFLLEKQDVMDDLCLDHLDEDGNWVISTSSSLPGASSFSESQQLPTVSSPSSSPQLESSPQPYSKLPARGTSSSLPDEQMMILRRAPTIVRNSPFGALSSFEYIMQETQLTQSSLRSDVDALERGIGATQTMLRDLAGQVRTTLDRYVDMTMEVSEEYYHNLKMLEDDITTINAKRAENPWLDAAYATLSYVLTFIAFIFWFTVQLFKAGRAVAIFPRTLWKAYSEYLEDRKKAAAAVDHGAAGAPMPPRTLTNPTVARVNEGAVME